MQQAIFYAAIGWMAILLGVTVLVIARGRSMASRILALDLLTLVLVGVLAVTAGEDRRVYVLDAALALSLLSFIGTLAACRYYEDRRPFR